MARKSFTEHPDFIKASHLASEAIFQAAALFACDKTLQLSSEFDIRANTIADDLTRLLLACRDKQQRKAA